MSSQRDTEFSRLMSSQRETEFSKRDCEFSERDWVLKESLWVLKERLSVLKVRYRIFKKRLKDFKTRLRVLRIMGYIEIIVIHCKYCSLYLSKYYTLIAHILVSKCYKLTVLYVAWVGRLKIRISIVVSTLAELDLSFYMTLIILC
jgi:hypothetical protein